MTQHAIVIPANPTEPVREVEFKRGYLLTMLRTEIKATVVQTVDLTMTIGELTVWLDEEGLFADPVVPNRRATALCAEAGRRFEMLVGNAVITGPPDENGETVGLPGPLRRRVLASFGQFVPAVTP